MDIVGLGTHVIECLRVRELIDRHAERFITNVYTEAEAAFCLDRTHTTEYYAAIWAAKDAVFRSLGIKTGKTTHWHDVEIALESKTSASALIRGATEARMALVGATKVFVAFSYSRQYATATAIAVR